MILHPLEDSARHAEFCRSVLDIPRAEAHAVAMDTVRILGEGRYRAPDGTSVAIAEALEAHRAGRRSVPPVEALPRDPAALPRPWAHTAVRVRNTTSLLAARQLAERGLRPCVLNFANGVSPGGGFLVGARAQEESLCFASTLYCALDGDPFYAYHAALPHKGSSPYLIACDATVVRDDHHRLLAAPWTMHVITCAAPVCRPNGGNGALSIAEGAAQMGERIDRVLGWMAAQGHAHLVLGAWGCGAFGNDPEQVAGHFARALQQLDGVFDEVEFAIAAWSPERRFLGPFARRLAAAHNFLSNRFRLLMSDW